MTPHYDVAVIGGGIVGLAHAWMAVRRGLTVVLLERSSVARGASVRNFGMIWPVGQPAGELYDIALRSRALWLELKSAGVLPIEECGSIHLAHREDEIAVLREFRDLGTHQCEMLTAEQALNRAPMANPDELLGGLWSPTELRVDPRTASARIAAWLTECHGVQCCFATPVTRVADNQIHAADGRKWAAEQIIVCSGSDLKTLYAEEFAESQLKLCKLQMMKTAAQPSLPPNAVHIASGLTLRHYTSFAACPSLVALKDRVAAETPELDRFGIHVMASPFPTGEVILGDSHEYGADITPFDNSEIDDLVLRELRKVVRLDQWTIQERWHGIYAKHPSLPVYKSVAADGTRIFVGTGGAGMTMSFGLADAAWETLS